MLTTMTVFACASGVDLLFPYLFLGALRSLGTAAAILAVPVGLVHWLDHRQKRRQWTRRVTGQCLTCGYDLRATPHRCPECGTTVERCESPVHRLPPRPDLGGRVADDGAPRARTIH